MQGGGPLPERQPKHRPFQFPRTAEGRRSTAQSATVPRSNRAMFIKPWAAWVSKALAAEAWQWDCSIGA